MEWKIELDAADEKEFDEYWGGEEIGGWRCDFPAMHQLLPRFGCLQNSFAKC